MKTFEESDLEGVVGVGVLHLQGVVGFLHQEEEVAALQQEEVEVEEEEEVELLLQERFA